MEENEEEREEKRDDFLSGTGGFGLPSPSDLVLGSEEVAQKKGELRGRAVRGEEGVRGEETGVPGVGVLDWLE